jgi:capsular exopolysaccharide synthesis family protein
VAVNLARSLAFAGSKVLLVDGDLRTGQLHRLLGVSPDAGLSQLSSQSCRLENLICPTSLPNLSFIGRGQPAPGCAELFLSEDLDHLLKEASAKFDFVLFDSAPLFAAADTTGLAPKLDAAIFVVRDSFTRARVAREALDQLYRLQVRVFGVVLNGARGADGGFQYFGDPHYQVSAAQARN